MKSKKLFSVFAAVMMVAVVGAVVFTSGYSDADDPPAVSNGTMTVNVRTSILTDWITDTVEAYNGVKALDRALNLHNISHSLDMDMYSYTGQYVSIDYQYGAIESIGGYANTTTASWHVYYYHATDGWIPATDTLGWYKPFEDYDIAHRTANIAVIYGSDSDVQTFMNNSSNRPAVVSSVVTTQQIIGNDNFKVSLYIKVNSDAYAALLADGKDINVTGATVTKQQVLDGVYVNGYGSDMYLALKNAFPNLVNGQEVVPYYFNGSYSTIYGWLNSFLGVSSVWQNEGDDEDDPYDDVWAWWQEYYYYSVDGNTGDVTGATSDFAIGLLSKLTDAPLSHPTFALYFAAGTM